MIIGLGLIHGFGLSTRLQELPLSTDSLLLNIISFNIGIELGQISALALMLLLIAAWRKRKGFQTFSLVANQGLILGGALLFLMQLHGYDHSTNPEEFSQTAEIAAVSNNNPPALWTDTIEVIIPPRGDKEYKLYLAKDATFEYSWQTDGTALFFDLHGEPEGNTTGYFKSFNKSTQQDATGSLTSIFAGPHGWYWKNNSADPVTIILKVKGAYKRQDLNEKIEQVQVVTRPKVHDTID
jgi:hypothetical protein